MTPQSKIDTVIELFNSGLLCNCNTREYVVIGEDAVTGNNIIREEIQHKKHCEGRIKAQELLKFESEFVDVKVRS